MVCQGTSTFIAITSRHTSTHTHTHVITHTTNKQQIEHQQEHRRHRHHVVESVWACNRLFRSLTHTKRACKHIPAAARANARRWRPNGASSCCSRLTSAPSSYPTAPPAHVDAEVSGNVTASPLSPLTPHPLSSHRVLLPPHSGACVATFARRFASNSSQLASLAPSAQRA